MSEVMSFPGWGTWRAGTLFVLRGRSRRSAQACGEHARARRRIVVVERLAVRQVVHHVVRRPFEVAALDELPAVGEAVEDLPSERLGLGRRRLVPDVGEQ